MLLCDWYWCKLVWNLDLKFFKLLNIIRPAQTGCQHRHRFNQWSQNRNIFGSCLSFFEPSKHWNQRLRTKMSFKHRRNRLASIPIAQRRKLERLNKESTVSVIEVSDALRYSLVTLANLIICCGILLFPPSWKKGMQPKTTLRISSGCPILAQCHSQLRPRWMGWDFENFTCPIRE